MLEIEAFTAENGQQAVDIAKVNDDEINFVLIDRFMPDMSGEETFQALREYLPGRPVLFMSGYNQQEGVEALNGEKIRFIKKPFSIMELRNTVTELISDL